MPTFLNNSVSISYTYPIYTLTLNTPENRFTTPFIQALNDALDWITENREYGKDQALVTVSASKKIWSNGLELSEMGKGASYFNGFQTLLARYNNIRERQEDTIT